MDERASSFLTSDTDHAGLIFRRGFFVVGAVELPEEALPRRVARRTILHRKFGIAQRTGTGVRVPPCDATPPLG
jgi:hypothetical protein